MTTPNIPACPLCFALEPALLEKFLQRTSPFLRGALAQCRCRDFQHRVLVAHPHVQPTCLGYAWVPEALTSNPFFEVIP